MSAKKKPTGKSSKTTTTKAGSKAGSSKASKKTGALRVGSALLDQLVQEAKAVRERAYAPYSNYPVGAAIATKSGAIYVGCNVENSSFGGTICAERGAIMAMVAAGERDPIACAVVTGDEGASPCGICRQVLSEFATDMPVVLVGLGSREGETGRVVQLADLLPLAFRFKR